jgi:hypothetical protein
MKPFKAGIAGSKWVLRMFLVFYLVVYHHKTLYPIDFLDVSFIFALIYVISAMALLVGGVKTDSSLTVYASIMMLVAIAFNLYLDIPDGIYAVIDHLFPLGVAFFFLSNGNK